MQTIFEDMLVKSRKRPDH